MDNLNTILKDRIISKINTDENTVVIHLKPKEKPIPKSWEEFCKMFPIKKGEAYFSCYGIPTEYNNSFDIRAEEETMTLPDLATAEAVRALCQLIQLRNAYNGDWVPDWKDEKEGKFLIEMYWGNMTDMVRRTLASTPLFFKTKELRDEFLRNFRPLIEKLKPLYGIKEGGEEWL